MTTHSGTGDGAGVYRTLLESTQAIPWRIDWAARIHAEDRRKTVDFCVSQSQRGVDHEADYRAPTARTANTCGSATS